MGATVVGPAGTRIHLLAYREPMADGSWRHVVEYGGWRRELPSRVVYEYAVLAVRLELAGDTTVMLLTFSRDAGTAARRAARDRQRFGRQRAVVLAKLVALDEARSELAHEGGGDALAPPAGSRSLPVVRRDTRVANQIDWPDHLAKKLGTVPDARLARRAKVSLSAVVRERQRRGVSPSRTFRPPIEWTEAMLVQLGEASDADVARALALSKSSVAYKRRALGIPCWGGCETRRPDPFWTPARVALLGTDRDLAVARRLRVSRGVVAAQRRNRGIPPFAPRRPKVAWTSEMVGLLGVLSDRRLAERFAIGEDTVRRERHRRGIPPLKDDSWKVVREPGLDTLLRLQTNHVVRLTGLNEKTVRKLRHDLGLAQPGIVTPWTPEALAFLGEVDDEALASLLGLRVDTVRLKRTQAGIKRRVTRRWTPAEDAIVRHQPAAVAAEETGRTLKAIFHRRHQLGLPRR